MILSAMAGSGRKRFCPYGEYSSHRCKVVPHRLPKAHFKNARITIRCYSTNRISQLLLSTRRLVALSTQIAPLRKYLVTLLLNK